MEMALRRFEKVYTADDIYLGNIVSVYHRRAPAEPALKLYADYLKVFDFESGGSYFIPLDFVATHEPTRREVRLDLTLRQVQTETFDRTPNFVAFGQADILPLAA